MPSRCLSLAGQQASKVIRSAPGGDSEQQCTARTLSMDFVFWGGHWPFPAEAASVTPTPRRTSDRPVGGDRVWACLSPRRCRRDKRRRGRRSTARRRGRVLPRATAGNAASLTRQTPFLAGRGLQDGASRNRRGAYEGGEPAAFEERGRDVDADRGRLAEWLERPCGALGPQADALPRDQGQVHVPGRDGRRDHRARLRLYLAGPSPPSSCPSLASRSPGSFSYPSSATPSAPSPRCLPASRIAGGSRPELFCGCRSSPQRRPDRLRSCRTRRQSSYSPPR